MENANLGLLISSPKLSFGTPRRNFNSCPSISSCVTRRVRSTKSTTAQMGFSVFAHSSTNKDAADSSTSSFRIPHFVPQRNQAEHFASISSSSSQETSSVGNPQLAVPPPSSSIGSPLFWIGVGVGASALFSWVASYLKKYAMQQAFKTMMGQMNPQSSQFNNATFPPGSPFPFPMPVTPPSTSSPTPAGSQSATMDITASNVEAAPSRTEAKTEFPATKVEPEPSTGTKGETEVKTEPKKYAFVDVSPEETEQKSPFESFSDYSDTSSPQFSQSAEKVPQNGAASDQGSQSTGKKGPTISVETLEKMMDDPTVQKMVYPYLPEEMRNPTTFKWMLQNPQYRQQLEEMLTNMSGNAEWDNKMMDQLKNFDFSSPEVKQQFDQIGMTPEEVISKIMANPDIAMAFQNPRVQQAIMDCSQNPLSIAKYQNDKEVMDIFNKISELFPGSAGPF